MYGSTEFLYKSSVSTLVQQVNTTITRLKSPDSSEQISEIFFLSLIRSASKTFKLSKPATCELLSRLFEEPMAAVNLTQKLSGVLSAACSAVIWARSVNIFYEKNRNDVNLENACARAPTAGERGQKKKEEFATSLDSYTGVGSDVFNEQVLISFFLCSILPTTAATLAVQVLWLSPTDHINFSVVRRNA